MKVRKNLLAWIGIILAVLGMGTVLIAPVSRWFVLIPVVVLVTALVVLLKGYTFVGIKTVKWVLVAAWSLVVLFTIATVLAAVFFGWLALIPFVLLCGATMWLVYLFKKKLVFLPSIVLVIAIILLGVYGIMGSFMGDWSKAIDTLKVKNLIVESEEVEKQTVEDQKVKDQKVDDQKVDDQTVTNQKVDKSEVKDQTVTNQKVDKQEVQNQTGVNKQETNKEDPKKDEGKKEEAHKHTYTSKVVAPTCTEKGYTLYTCNCGDSYKDAYKNELGHNYTSKVVAPTTAAQGYTLHTCSRCGNSYKDNYTAKLETEVTPAIKCAKTIRYGETLYVNLEGIKASNLLVSNKNFVAVEKISDSRVAITLTEDVDGYITITDSVSRENVVIDIA